MKVLGISGSLNTNGSTAYAVQHALEHLMEKGVTTRYLTVAGRDITPCDGCWACRDAGVCVYGGDDMDEIVDSMRWCDALIVGSPVYFGLLSGPLKIVMDRSLVLRTGDERFEMTGKPGAGIACGGFRNGGQEMTLKCIQTWMLIHNMIVVSDGAPFSHFGATIVDDARSDELGLKTVRNMADHLQAVTARMGVD
ncbi:MAG: flavodoxin family protein [Anaerolineae bacterium]|nr:flavodoxin family protein [Anaerolineae bacterium]